MPRVSISFVEGLIEDDINREIVIGALHNAGYDGYLTAEMLVSTVGLPDTFLAKMVARDLRGLIDQYG